MYAIPPNRTIVTIIKTTVKKVRTNHFRRLTQTVFIFSRSAKHHMEINMMKD